MELVDFFPKYPSINQSKYPNLNPYPDFYDSLYRKREFYENRLEQSEKFPQEKGTLMKYQRTIARYLSSHTPYDRLLVVHAMGTGKTCSTIGAIEQLISEGSPYVEAIILAKGDQLLDNFSKELVYKCTDGKYIPEKYDTELQLKHRLNKKIRFYQFDTFVKFAKQIKNLSDEILIQNYSNRIFVIDEVHNLRIQSVDDEDNTATDKLTLKESIETYNQYHRLLHLVQNCKILFLSGTPMKDGPEEIAAILNLLLPLDKQLPIENEFLEKYMMKRNDSYVFHPDKIDDFKSKTKGLISFLREEYSSIPKKFIGIENFQNLEHFTVEPCEMSSFQTDVYLKVFASDNGYYPNAREANLFVFPDGSFGRKGFGKYVSLESRATLKSKNIVKTYSLNSEFKKALLGKTHEETLKNIEKHSTVYAKVIRKILETKGNCFVYSSIVQGSGAILFSLLLELFDFTKSNGNDTSQKSRYSIITQVTTSSNETRSIIDKFNSKENIHGEIIKVIIGSRTISEGISLHNVVFEAILTPHWNYSEIAQAIARGIRLNSHANLIKNGEKPTVQVMQTVAIPKASLDSIDLRMYQISVGKDIGIKNVMRVLLESAFDCSLNYLRNLNKSSGDYTRECDYMKCNFTCDGMDMNVVRAGLNEDEIDNSTYQLYYIDPNLSKIRQKIINLYRGNKLITLDTIFEILRLEHSEEEITNAFFSIKEGFADESFDYRYLFTNTPVRKIRAKIEEMFQKEFLLEFDRIAEKLSEFSRFEILTALYKIITENIVITNRYGFNSYLKEDNNVYFVVNDPNSNVNFYSEYYSEKISILDSVSFNSIIHEINSLSLPKSIEKLCSLTEEQQIVTLLKSLPSSVHQLLAEYSFLAEQRQIKQSVALRQTILKYFKNYINTVNEIPIINIERAKCFENGKWKECDVEEVQKLERTKRQETEVLKQNKYGIIGTYNPENSNFCIIDVSKEKDKMKGKDDNRLVLSGKVCSAGGWKWFQLLDIVASRLKINPPEGAISKPRDEMITAIRANPKLAEYTTEALTKMSESHLGRIYYWSSSAKHISGIIPLCQVIKRYLELKGLLQIDNKCGVQGKRKATSDEASSTGTKATSLLTIREFICDKTFIEHYGSELRSQFDACFEKLSLKPDNSKWYIVFSKKKLVASANVVDSKLVRLCVSKNYRRQEIHKNATRLIFDTLKEGTTLQIPTSSKEYNKLLRMYRGYGLTEKMIGANVAQLGY